MASDLAIVELTEELELYQVLLQSLDDDGRGSDTERQELLNTIKSLESRLEQRRLEQTGMRQAPPPSPSSPSSQSSAYSSVSPVLQKDLSRNSPAFPRWGSSAMPAPAPQSRPAQPSNGYSHLPSHTGRKRAPENAGLLDTPGHTPKRVASFGSPGPSRRQSAATDDSDELWRALGIDSRESFTEFQDAQKNAEQWLEGRREEERRDAEYARRLQDNLLASPRPDLAQSGSTSYSGSNVFNGLDSPVPRSGPTGPGPLARNPFSGIPPLSSVTGRANGLSNPPLPPASNPVAHPARHPAEERLRSVSPWNSDGESDLAEITSADFQRRVYNPPFAPLMDRPNPDFGAFPPPYPSWAPAIGPSGRPGPGPLYGPNVLQSTMARLNASRGAMGGYLGSTPGIFDMMGFDPDGLYTVGPLDYLRYFPQPEPISLISDFPLSETLARDSKKTNEEIKQLLETIRPDSDIESREGTPDALLYPLLEHQKLGLSWMKTMEESEKKGGILADDMGLGKTIQAIALMVSRPSTNTERRPTLIIAPVSLMQQWKREIERMLRPGRYQLSVYILHGGSQKRGACYSDLKGYDVVLTTYGTLASELKRKEEYEKEEQTGRNAAQSLASIHRLPVLGTSSKWHRVILDEAQCIKNRNTKSAQAACCLNATYRWCMSGTPMMNNVEELHSLLKFLRIRPYCALEKFGAVSEGLAKVRLWSIANSSP